MEEIVLQIPFSIENLKTICRYLKVYADNKYYPLFHQYAMKQQGPLYNVKDIHQMWTDSVTYVVSPEEAKKCLQEMSQTNIINLKAMTEDNVLVTIQDGKQVYVNKQNALTVFQILVFEKRWSTAFQIFKKHGLDKNNIVSMVKANPESIGNLQDVLDKETVCLLNLAYGKTSFLKDSQNPQIGDIVVRGPDWEYDNQDGGAGNLGRVTSGSSDWNRVNWPKGITDNYRMGQNDCYDLEIIARRIDNKNLQIGDYVRNKASDQIYRITKIEDDCVITESVKFLKSEIAEIAREITRDSTSGLKLPPRFSSSKVFEILPEFFSFRPAGGYIKNIGVALLAKNKWILEHLFKDHHNNEINWNGLDTLTFDSEYIKEVKALAVSDDQRQKLDKIKAIESYKNPIIDAETLEAAIKSL